MVKYLNHPLKKFKHQDIYQDIPIALVDTQPGTGNNPLLKGLTASIVIDHHALKDASSNAKYVDVRPEIGASATILTEYLRTAGLEIPATLATALFYGIKTDTMGLGRNASQSDKAAYLYLQPQVDVDALVQIERAQVPLTDFKSLDGAIHTARVYDNDLVISYIGKMKYPDLGAEIADLLTRLKGVNLVLCMGTNKSDLILSVRSRSQQIRAGKLVQHIIGDLGTAGGHGTMAGGQIRLSSTDPELLVDQLSKEVLQYIKGDDFLVGKPFI